jgi:hypothetical protein
MASGNITSTTNTFGDVPGTLSGSIGVPGPVGPTGAQGPQGDPGEGVPVGGTAGQFLTKIDGTNYNTDWTTVNLSVYAVKANNLSDLTSASTARTNLGLGTMAVETASNYALLDSPALTGNPTAPTATFGDNDTSIATTAFVQAGLLGGTANARNLEVEVRNQSGSTIPAGSIVYISGATGNLPLITLAQANNDTNSAQTIGFVKTAIANNGTGYVIVRGVLEAINTSALTEGVQLYLSPTTAGTWTTTKPSAPQHMVYVGVVIRSHPTQGTILVAVQNGYELHELHDVALASEANNDLLVYELSTDLWKNKSFATLGLAGLNSPTFTGTPSLPTGTTAVTQTAGNNTTALATTAFVTAAVPAVATVANSFAQNNTAPVTALTSLLASVTPAVFHPMPVSMSAAQAGTGATSAPSGSSILPMAISLQAPNASTTGYAAKGIIIGAPSLTNSQSIDWSKPMAHSCRLYSSTLATAKTDVRIRAVIGRDGNTFQVPGTLAVKGFGWEFNHATGVLSAIAHNGTTLTTTAVTFTPVNFRPFDIVCYYDGAGTVSIYVNGTLAGSATGGPTGAATVTNIWAQWEIENTSTSSPANTNCVMINPKVMTTF